MVGEKRQEKLARIKDRAETIIGVTAYKPPREMPPSIEDVARRAASARRLAEAFEAPGVPS
jgi:methylmalonyl-CoA mutase N-terminal domain/subunit